MNDINQESNTIVLETPFPSDDDMGEEDMDDESVWDEETVILDDVLVAIAKELENGSGRYICDVITNIFLPQIKQ
eukprot:3469707-Ditylum_brightwellii.AAC.1